MNTNTLYIDIYSKKRLGYIILNQSTNIYRKDGNRIGGGQMSLERLMLVKLDFNLPPRSLWCSLTLTRQWSKQAGKKKGSYSYDDSMRKDCIIIYSIHTG